MPKTSCDVCASVGYLCPHCSTSDAAGRAALPDPPTDEADLRDIIERLRANLAAIETLGGDNAVSDGEVLAAAWATSATIHLNELCAALPAAALPDERLREALTRANDDLIQIADYSPSEVADAIDSVRAAIKDALAADREENTDA